MYWRRYAPNVLAFLLIGAVALISGRGLAEEPSPGEQTAGEEKSAEAAGPNLADIVPLAGDLTGRLAELEDKMRSEMVVSELEKKFDGIRAASADLSEQLESLRGIEENKYNRLVAIKEELNRQKLLSGEISGPVTREIRQLENWRREWLSEQKKWREWRTALKEEGAIDELESTFEKVENANAAALDRVLSRLEALLSVQKNAGDIDATMDAVSLELNALIEDERRSALIDASPPMLSFKFFTQFKSGELWRTVLKNLGETAWLNRQWIGRLGWIVLLQGFFPLCSWSPFTETGRRWAIPSGGGFSPHGRLPLGFFWTAWRRS